MNTDKTQVVLGGSAAASAVAPAGGGFKQINPNVPTLLTIAGKAGLFTPVRKSEPLTQEQEDRIISGASAKLLRRCARNLKNKANGGY